MSLRVDLLPPDYIMALMELQDRVAAFETEEAYECVTGALLSTLIVRSVCCPPGMIGGLSLLQLCGRLRWN